MGVDRLRWEGIEVIEKLGRRRYRGAAAGAI